VQGEESTGGRSTTSWHQDKTLKLFKTADNAMELSPEMVDLQLQLRRT